MTWKPLLTRNRTCNNLLTGTWKRNKQTATPHFYDGKVSSYANQVIKPVTLRELLKFHSPVVSENQILENSRYVREQLPARLARRVRALQNLPFIVGTNPHVREVYDLYYKSFEMIRNYPEVTTEADDAKFTRMLAELVDSHSDVIPKLARGFQEGRRYMIKRQTAQFLDDMIHARIGIRLIGEQHIALHHRRQKNVVGVIEAELRPAEAIRACADHVANLCEIHYGSAPDLIIDGDLETTFAYVPVHLEYIMSELLKNAYRATVENSRKIHRRVHPPVQVTVSHGEGDIAIRVRDEGGGVAPSDVAKIFDYSYTTVSSEDDDDDNATAGDINGTENIFAAQSHAAMQTGVGGPIAGLGFGLPLAKIYAQYFGGSMDLVSLHRYGTDIFISLKNLDMTNSAALAVDMTRSAENSKTTSSSSPAIGVAQAYSNEMTPSYL